MQRVSMAVHCAAFVLAGCATPDETPAVRAASAAWDAAYDKGDVTALAALYTDDAVSMPPAGKALEGRAAIEGDFKAFFTENRGHHETQGAVVRIDGDTAVERARYLNVITPKAGGPAITERGRHIVVRARQPDGSWKVLWEIWNAGT